MTENNGTATNKLSREEAYRTLDRDELREFLLDEMINSTSKQHKAHVTSGIEDKHCVFCHMDAAVINAGIAEASNG